ncbi:MAG: AI-2E family transporter [Gammaproteobacteria bacterium]
MSSTLTEELNDTEKPSSAESEPVLHSTVESTHVALTVLAVLAVIFALHWAQQVLIPLVLSILLSYALGPLVTRLEKWKIPRALGAAVVLIAIITGIGYSAYTLSDDLSTVVTKLPAAAQKLTRTLRDERSKEPGTIDQVQKAATEIGKAAAVATGNTAKTPAVVVAQPTFNIREYFWVGTMGLLALIGQTIVVIFTVYFLLVSGDLFKRKLAKITGPTLARKRITVQILDEINSQIQRFMLVQVFTSIIVGLATWLAFRWVGLEQAAMWGLAAGVLNSIPYLGPVIVTGGTAIVAFMQFGTISMALVVGGISLVITSLEGFLLTPWLTSRAGRMNAVVVFVGVLFWGWLWGVWGLLLGIPIIMTIKAVCDHIEELQSVGELLGD